jgi:hypothetical protein
MTDTTTTEPTNSGNEITGSGKFWAGLLLIVLTSAAILLVIAYWPNKMPDIKDGDDAAWYTRKCFNVMLIEKTDCMLICDRDSLKRSSDSVEAKMNRVNMEIKLNDTAVVKKDSTTIKKLKDSLQVLEKLSVNLKTTILCGSDVKRIHLNTILLLLVALMGFLGNMVHIATSFTTFVGNQTFKRSWILWYCVKPFTAAGLALILYFIIRAGFLSYGTGASGVSLYGILSLSALAGLFTDSATLKLKEVFEVIFKPKDDRKDKLVELLFSITTVSPLTIAATGASTITLTGKNLDKADLKITIDGKPAETTSVTAEKVELKYTPLDAAIAAGKAVLLVTDKAGKTPFTKDITITT